MLFRSVAVYMVIGTSAPANSVRPTETIRVEHKGDEGAKQAASPSVPAPEGTLRRMDGISKAFKK